MPRALIAFVLSCLLYLLPIMHIHGGTLLGAYLWAMFVEGGNEFHIYWKILATGLSVVLQLVWFVAFYWILGGSWLRWLMLTGLVPASAVAVVVAYVLAIPMLFLIERDDLPEVGDWPVVCSVPDASTADFPTGVTLALERAGEVWIHSGDTGYAVLSGTDCRLTQRKLFFPGIDGGIGYVAPRGAALFRMDGDGDGEFEYWFLAPEHGSPQRLDTPDTAGYWMPVVDSAASALAWLETRRDDDGKILGHVITARTLPDGPQRRIALHMDRTASPRLLDFDLAAGRFIVLRNYREFYVVGPDGWAAEAPVRPTGFEHVGTNFRLLDGGWVAWDGYRDNARYRVGWSLAGGDGLYEIPKGRSISAVSVAPDGRFIAVSVSAALSIGSVRDSVRVIRVADGAEVWRRYMPRYTRSQVAFLGAGRLALTVVEGSNVRVDVLQVPVQ